MRSVIRQRRKPSEQTPGNDGLVAGGGAGHTPGLIASVRAGEPMGAALAEKVSLMRSERFREVFTRAPLGIAWTESATGRFREVNPRFAEIVGRTAEQLVGVDWMSITHPDDLPENLCGVAAMHAGEINSFSMDKRYLRPDGSIVWVNVSVAPANSMPWGNRCHLCTIVDITERKRLEQSLRNQSMAVEQSPVTIVITDPEGNIEFVNPMFTELTGYSREEVLGKKPSILQSGLVEPQIYQKLWETISSGFIWEGEFANKKKSGELFWEQARIAPIRNDQGQITNYIALKQNITDRKISEERLYRSEAALRQLFDQSNDAIVILTTGHVVIDLNCEAEKLFGFSLQEFIGLNIYSLVSERDRPLFIGAVAAVNIEYRQIEKMIMHKKDGSQLFVSARLKLVTVNEHNVVYCSFRNITERIHLEEDAQMIQTQLIQSEKMASLGVLVSGIAHEINNPTNYILFNSELLSKTWKAAVPILEDFYRENGEFKLGSFKFSETQDIIPKLFSGLVDGAERIRNIVDMLKNFARQDKGDTDVPFDVNQVVSNAIAILNHEIKKCCNHFYLDAEHDLVPAQGNAQQIEQVIINLVLNALQSLPDKKCAVRLSTAMAPCGDRIAITVADEGEGMSSEVLQHLTEPFFTTKGDSGGTGLGLSISASILRQNKGSISFTSEQGKGTIATVLLRVFPEQKIHQ
jgi:PAS domain S-box-containing protein